MRTPSSALPACPNGLREGVGSGERADLTALLAPLFAPPLAARAAGVRDLSFTTFFEAAFDFTFVFALAFAFEFFAAFRVAIPCSP
jgi:hypothetical protein